MKSCTEDTADRVDISTGSVVERREELVALHALHFDDGADEMVSCSTLK